MKKDHAWVAVNWSDYLQKEWFKLHSRPVNGHIPSAQKTAQKSGRHGRINTQTWLNIEATVNDMSAIVVQPCRFDNA